jgi:hypothetical protein
MKCPFCQGHNLRVIDTRSIDNDSAITRRRECQGYKNRWRTIERVEFAERGKLPVGRPANGSPGIELVKVEPERKGNPGRNGYNHRKEIAPLPAPAPGPVETQPGPLALTRAEKKRQLQEFMARYRAARDAAR